jgi:hypothetical protein
VILAKFKCKECANLFLSMEFCEITVNTNNKRNYDSFKPVACCRPEQDLTPEWFLKEVATLSECEECNGSGYKTKMEVT